MFSIDYDPILNVTTFKYMLAASSRRTWREDCAHDAYRATLNATSLAGDAATCVNVVELGASDA